MYTKDLPCKNAERKQKQALQNDTLKYSLRHLVHILQHLLKCQWCQSVDFLSKNIVSQDILFHYQTHCHLHKTCNGRTQGYLIPVSPLCTINYSDDTKISHEVQILCCFTVTATNSNVHTLVYNYLKFKKILHHVTVTAAVSRLFYA